MRLISDDILIDSGAQRPFFDQVYPSLEGFQFSNPSSWTKGHPFELYKEMQKNAPVMWSSPQKNRGKVSGFWCVTKYEDIKKVELSHRIFSSQRGGINMSVPQRKYWRPRNLVMASLNSLINADEPLHREMRMQQSEFFFPAYVAKIKEKVGLKIDALLDDMEKKGPVIDFVEMFSQELPLFTLCEMLGVDDEDRPKVKIWMHYLELASQFLSNPWQTFFSEPSSFKYTKLGVEFGRIRDPDTAQ